MLKLAVFCQIRVKYKLITQTKTSWPQKFVLIVVENCSYVIICVKYCTLPNAVRVQYRGYPYAPVACRMGKSLDTHWMDRSRLIGLMANYKYKEKINKMTMKAKIVLRNKRQVSVGCKSDTSSNRGNWNHSESFRKCLEQHLESTTSRHCRKQPYGHCVRTSESSNVKSWVEASPLCV